jgi:hypothetical protein
MAGTISRFGNRRARSQAPNKSAAEKLKFTGIDVLNVTLGKIPSGQQATGHGEEIDFGHKTQILRNVRTGADLSSLGLAALLQSKTTSSGDADVDLNQVLDSLFK